VSELLDRLREVEGYLESALERLRVGDWEGAGRDLEAALDLLRDLVLDLEEEEVGKL
jgi:hypothetical protein